MGMHSSLNIYEYIPLHVYYVHVIVRDRSRSPYSSWKKKNPLDQRTFPVLIKLSILPTSPSCENTTTAKQKI